MWYTEGIIKMQKCVIEGSRYSKSPVRWCFLASKPAWAPPSAPFFISNLLDLKLTSGARMMITDG